MFKDRAEAGRLLAQKLLPYRNSNQIVVALPRGGVVPGYEIAKALNIPLDIFFVKKIPSPYNKEAGIGAVSENGYYFVDPNAKKMLNISDSYIQNAIKEVLQKIKEKRAIYNKPRLDYKDKEIILVDDGVATGSSMLLAIDALKKEGAKKIIVAAPVAPLDVANRLKEVANNAVFLEIPTIFNAVGEFYEDFHQLSDSEVLEILKKVKE